MSFGWSTGSLNKTLGRKQNKKMSCPTIVTVKYWNILLWKVKISSDKDATGQARQLCWHRFNCNWSCSWARKMDWIRSSWAMGRQWHILGGPGKAPEEFNLVFLFFQPSPLEVLSQCHLKNVVLTLSQKDRKGAEPSDSPCLGAHFEHCQWPAGGTLVPCSLHSLSKSELNCVKVMLTTAAEIPWRLALLFLVKFRSTTEEHLEAWDVRNGVISLGRQSLGQGEEDSIDTWHSGSGCRTQLPRDKILAIEQK